MASELELFQEFFEHFLRSNYSVWQDAYIILTDANFRQESTISSLFIADKKTNEIKLLRAIGSRSREKYNQLESHGKGLDFLFNTWLCEKNIQESDNISETLQKRIGRWSIPIRQPNGELTDSVLTKLYTELGDTKKFSVAPRIYNSRDYSTDADLQLNRIFGGLPNEEADALRRQDAFFGLPGSNRNITAIVGCTNLYKWDRFGPESFRDIGLTRIVLSEFLQQQEKIERHEEEVVKFVRDHLRNPLIAIEGFGRRLEDRVNKHTEHIDSYLSKARENPELDRETILDNIGSLNLLFRESVNNYCTTIINEVNQLEIWRKQMEEYQGSISLNYQSLDMNRAVASALEKIKPELPPHIQIHTKYGPTAPQVNADNTKIEASIYNILKDSINTFNGNNGEILVSTTEGNNFRNNGTGIPSYVEVSIINLNRQMSDEDVKNLFYPLSEDGSNKKYLYLPIANKYIQAHQGLILAEKDANQINFRVIIPK